MTQATENKVNVYLYYGYLPPAVLPDWLGDCLSPSSDAQDYTVSGLSRLFDRIIDQSLSVLSSDGYCIIPVSGGWDSRILLGAALERFETGQIKTFSFGVRGQLDFDIGKYMAQKSGVEHLEVQLSEVEVSWEKMMEATGRIPWTSPFDSFFNRLSVEKLAGRHDVVLSGFVGDVFTGGHLLPEGRDARTEFVRKQQFAGSSLLTHPNYNPMKELPELPEESWVSLYDQLDFGVRQVGYSAPVVIFQNSWEGWGSQVGTLPDCGAAVIAPFIHPEWASYWLKAPRSVKVGQSLYLKLLHANYPELGRMPYKGYFGARSGSGMEYEYRKLMIRIQNRCHVWMPALFPPSRKMCNYIDYNTAFRVRDDYRSLLNRATDYLKENGVAPWLNLDNLTSEHREYRADHGDAFQLIIGLALNLANEKSQAANSQS